MRRGKAIVALAIMMGLAICAQSGCSVNHSQDNDSQSWENVQIANPWRDITETEAKNYVLSRLAYLPERKTQYGAQWKLIRTHWFSFRLT